MASQQITGELRKWHLDRNTKGERCVIGNMYNDELDIWEDGEEAIIFYVDWVVSVNYYIAVTKGGGFIKCPKDEEDKNAKREWFNGV